MRRYFQILLLFVLASKLYAQEPSLQEPGLFVHLSTGGGGSLTYSLDYRGYPEMVAAFLQNLQHEEVYQQLYFSNEKQALYGNALASLPSLQYSLPNYRSETMRTAPGLAFMRSGSVLRSDLLMAYIGDVSVRDRGNMVFFGDLIKGPSKLSKKHGLELVRLEVNGSAAQEFADALGTDFLESLEEFWDNYLKSSWPDVYDLVTQGAWERDVFGYYSRTVKEGSGDLPEQGEDLNINLERKVFADEGAQELPVIINFGKDALPMPFLYFVGMTPKRSVVEILCPPSVARQQLSLLNERYNSTTRYQWLQDTYKSKDWVYLSFALE